MDLQVIQNLISGLGFPIVCTLGLGYFVFKIWNAQREDFNKQLQEMTERADEREKCLYSLMDKYNMALSDAVETLARIDTRISVLEKIITTEADAGLQNGK